MVDDLQQAYSAYQNALMNLPKPRVCAFAVHDDLELSSIHKVKGNDGHR